MDTRRAPSGLGFVALVLATTLLAPRAAHANGPEDQLGLGARAAGLGGAGTALGGDPSATYYNVAGLTFCPESQVFFDVRHTGYGMRTERLGPGAPAGDARRVADQTRTTVGACLKLPRHFAAGILFGAGLQDPASFEQRTQNTDPLFVGYGAQLSQLTIALGAAWRPIPELAIGFGGAVIVNSDLEIATVIPVGGDFDVAFDLGWKLKPTGAPYVGVLVAPLPELKIGLAYRGEISHRLFGPIDIQASLGGTPLPFPMQLVMETWVSPRQVALGGSYAPIRALTLVADVTWYGYRALRATPYPFIQVTGDAPLLEFPVLDPLDWRNVWAVRTGAELRLADERLALRAGYNFRTSMIGLPSGRNTTVLDASVHGFTLGAGYVFGARRHRPDERRERTPTPAPLPRREVRPGYEAEGWVRTDSPRYVVRLDGFGRASVMPERRDEVQQLAFRGVFFDAGLTATLGWY